MSPIVHALRVYTLEESLILRVHAGYKPRPGWQRRSACLGATNQLTVAKLCPGCPVRLDCLAATMHAEAGQPKVYVCGHMAVSAGKRKAMQLPKPREHGTDAGYQQHVRAGEDACDPCKEAHALRAQINKENRRTR